MDEETRPAPATAPLDIREERPHVPPAIREEALGQSASDEQVSRRAKYCRLTAAGRRAPGTEAVSWQRFVDAVALVLAAET